MVQRKSRNHVNEVEVLGGVPRHLLKDFLPALGNGVCLY